MRGDDQLQGAAFSYVSPEQRVPQDHPLRAIRAMVNQALADLSPELDALYPKTGRPSIPPEHLIRALLLQVFYSVRSERMLMEQLSYNLLFRWFVGLNMDDPIWHPTVFTKNRDRFLDTDMAAKLLEKVLEQAGQAKLLSDEHFTVDGTLVEAWASMKSVRPKDGSGPTAGGGKNPDVDFRGEKRANETHASVTDPDARLARKGKGKETKLCYMGHVLMENRSGLVVGTRTTLATGTAEREAALEMVKDIPGGQRQITVGADKGYDSKDFVSSLRQLCATPHVTKNEYRNRSSAIDGRVTRHPGYAVSQKIRKRIEEAFGWAKTIGGMRKTHHRGLNLVGWMFTLTLTAYNLTRMGRLLAEAPS
jgi:transposase